MRTSEPQLFRILGWNVQGDLGDYTFYTSKRKGLVWFLKAPPTKPPTAGQVHQRNKFRIAAECWQALSSQQRANWTTAGHAANLSITGYNFFIFYLTKGTRAHVETIENQTGIILLPLWTE